MKKYSILIATALLGILLTGCNSKTNDNSLNTNRSNSTRNEVVYTVHPADQKTLTGTPFNNAYSAWADGAWTSSKGLHGKRYVISVKNTSQLNSPVIKVYNVNDSSEEFVTYNCPRNIGNLTITGITLGGLLVHFTSTQGTHGTLNLLSHHWKFSS